jgi:alpha-ribazole phosphatase
MLTPPKDFPPFYLMRHGESQANVAGIVAGRTQTDLTPNGIVQARAAGEFVRTLPLTKAYCSPLNRTRQTLTEMQLAFEVEMDERLMETDFGDYDGKPFEHWKKSGISVALLYANPEQKIAGGESFGDVVRRGLSFISERQKERDAIFCVTHGSFIKMMLACLYPARFEAEIRKRTIGNCEIFRFLPDGFESIYGESIWH